MALNDTIHRVTGRIVERSAPVRTVIGSAVATTAGVALRPRSIQPATPAPTTSIATSANVIAMPSSIGSPARRNGWSARANTNGSTGRMHGLRMVSTPPR